MSEEDKSTKEQLNDSNFKVWKQQIYLLLRKKNLIEYIYTEKLKKISGKNLTDDQKEGLYLVDGTTDTYYAQGTKKSTIDNDIKTKGYLSNSIGNDIAIICRFHNINSL